MESQVKDNVFSDMKQVRGELDGLSNGLQEISLSAEVIRAKRHVLSAKAWLGKAMEGLGNGTPYANDGKRSTVEQIEKTADIGFCVFPKKQPELIKENEDGSKEWTSVREYNHIEKVDWLREEIKMYIGRVEVIRDKIDLNRLVSIAFTNAYTHLCEARFELGFELQRIKENN